MKIVDIIKTCCLLCHSFTLQIFIDNILASVRLINWANLGVTSLYPMDRGAWWATVHGVAKNWTWLSTSTLSLSLSLYIPLNRAMLRSGNSLLGAMMGSCCWRGSLSTFQLPLPHQELPEASEAISWESLLLSLTVTSTGAGALSFLISTSIQKIQS